MIDLKGLEKLDVHLERVKSLQNGHKKEEKNGIVTKEEWELDYPKKLVVKQCIARGNFASVHRGAYLGRDDIVVKVLDWGEEGRKDASQIALLRNSFKQEVSVWHKLDHPNISKLIGAVTGAQEIEFQFSSSSDQIDIPKNICCLVTEYCPGGTLKSFLIKKHIKKLSFEIVMKLILGLAKGLSYLHSKNIVHRDIKTENILLGKDLSVKITDFGVARIEALDPSEMTGNTGTPIYMAPEVIQSLPYNKKCDVYSFGICIWEIYCCEMPYGELGFDELTRKVVYQKLRPEIPKCCPKSLAKVMKACWEEDPTKRPDMDQVVSMLEAIDTSKGRGMTPLDEQQQGCFCLSF